MNFTSWSNEGENRSYPFQEPGAGESIPPQDFLLDLRMFLSGREEVGVYLKSAIYADGPDEWTLEFADPETETVLISGTIARVGGVRKILGSGASVCIFITGPSWDDPVWSGVGVAYVATEAQIERSLQFSGPRTFRRVIIDGVTDPLSGALPLEAELKIVGGYNVEMSSRNGIVKMEAGSGLGAGYPPAAETPNYVRTINGQGPDDRGNVSLTGVDCYRVSRVRTEDELVPATVQIQSDCSPCCGCENYRKMAKAIERRNAKLIYLCGLANDAYSTSVSLFNQGVALINAKTRPMIAVGGVSRTDTMLTFLVYNKSTVSAYGYVAVQATGDGTDLLGLGTFDSFPNGQVDIIGAGVAGAAAMEALVTADLPSLDPMP